MQKRGFTLIELMIVVAIIAIILSLAIPSLQNARKSANEGRAIATLRSISTVQEQYKTRFGAYADWVGKLEDAGYIAIRFDEYDVLYYSGETHRWYLSAGPRSPADADRYFFVDQTGVIRFSSTGPATSTDPPIE